MDSKPIEPQFCLTPEEWESLVSAMSHAVTGCHDQGSDDTALSVERKIESWKPMLTGETQWTAMEFPKCPCSHCEAIRND